MYVTVDGARLFFDTVGSQLAIAGPKMEQRPSLLVLHGGPGFDHSTMRPYFDRFADTHQVIYLDHRGNGRSGGERDTWTLPRWGDDIAAFCDSLGIVKPVVFGQSFGGMVAMAYATRHPDHPAKLVLSSTAARLDLPATYDMMEKLGGSRARAIAETFWSKPTPEDAAEYMAVCMPLYNPGKDPALAAARARAIHRLEVMFAFIQTEQTAMDMTADLAKIACPTLVLGGREDPITPVSCAEQIHRCLPAGLGTLEIFEGAGHGVYRDQPDAGEASLRRFFGT
ncbi:MAG: alpha/beta hydrolase [Caulobacteraceae bacterium]